jgi:hypothetical protein
VVIAVLALARTVRADPRPALGFVVTVVAAALGLGVVVGGGLDLAGAHPETAPALEAVMQLTALSSTVASFVSARGLAISLLPETRCLRALGVSWMTFWAFGAVVISSAAVVVVLFAIVVEHRLRTSWVVGLAEVLGVTAPPSGGIPSGVITCLLVVVCAAGWRSGLRAGRLAVVRSGRAWRLASAFVVAALFLVPSVLAVAFAPHLMSIVSGARDETAAGRLTVLDSSDGPLIVMSAAGFGLVGAAAIVASDASQTMVGSAARLLRSGPISPFVGLCLARARIGLFGALTTLVAAGVGLTVTRTMTATVASSLASERAGAGLVELGLTLGPALFIAAAASVGSALAQSRGTGSDLATLRHIGSTQGGTIATLSVAAVAIGASGSLIGVGAALGVALVAFASGVDASWLAAMDPTVPLVAVLTATLGTAAVFVCSELVGVVLHSRRSRRRGGAQRS